MATVELLYFPDCPNVPAARDQLRRAFDAVGLPATWTEIDVSSDAAPPHTRGFGSPSILVDGRDIAGVAAGTGSSCRIYPGSDVRGVPPLDAIVSALRVRQSTSKRGGFPALAVLPGAIVSILPVVGCPSCWPTYASVLSSLGMPFLMEVTWLRPVTVGALLLAIVGLAYQAPRRHGFGPVLLGAFAALIILGGKFVFDSDAAVYAGTAFLLIASIWNSWPKKARSGEDCRCQGDGATA